MKAAKATTAQTELLENMALLLSSNCAWIQNNFPNDRLLANRSNSFFILCSPLFLRRISENTELAKTGAARIFSSCFSVAEPLPVWPKH